MKKFFYFSLFLITGIISVITTASADVKIDSKEGTVLINGDTVSVGETINSGDEFKVTGADSPYFDLRVDTAHKIRFKNASGTFRSLNKNINLKLDKGITFSSFKNTDTNNYTIETKHGVAGIRGTKFFLKSTPKKMYVCVCTGAVSVSKQGLWASLFGESKTVPAGSDIHVYGDKPIPDPAKNPRMVSRTWQVFESMGFEPPEKYDE